MKKLIFTAALAMALPQFPVAAANFDALEFLKAVGCSQIPLSACDALDPENAQNIILTYKALLVNKNCGYGSIEAAKQAVENEIFVLDEVNCRRLLRAFRVI